MSSQLCEWFALCDRPADGVVSHPILGWVPTCQRCADKLGLELSCWAILIEATPEGDVYLGPYLDQATAEASLESLGVDGIVEDGCEGDCIALDKPIPVGQLTWIVSPVTEPDFFIRPQSCSGCGAQLHQASEKAIASGEVQLVWADADGAWVCPATGNEHELVAEVAR